MASAKSRIRLLLWPLTIFFVLFSPLKHSIAQDQIVIGSKPFTENRILAEIFASMIEANTDLKVERQFNLGATGICFEALIQGSIDLYPEYTGTGLTAILHEPVIQKPEAAYQRVKTAFVEKYSLEWLKPLGFNNTYALIMRKAQAEALGIKKISDLKQLKKPLKLGFSHEFLARPDGWPGLKKVYQLPFSDRQVRGLDHGLAYSGLIEKKLDIMDAYSTDGKLKKFPLTLLEDDRAYFPPYQAAPLVRMDTLKQHPELRELLNQLHNRIPNASMQNLNFRLEEEGLSLKTVARDFLLAEQLVQPEDLANDSEQSNPQLWRFFWDRRYRLMGLVQEHLVLTGLAVGLATLFGVPLGIAITRFPGAARYVLSGTGILQTIPSLALLGFLVPVMGTGFAPALIALTVYALLPIVRNTYTGMREVSPELKEAALGMGLTPRQLLWKIELPLAATIIMAGIRTATVIAIGTATLAAFIGAGGLGDPIITGLSLKSVHWILFGVIPAAGLALGADYLLALLEHRLAPRTQS